MYGDALEIEFRKAGIAFQREVSLAIYYEGTRCGRYRTDFLVCGVVVVELKATEVLHERHVSQTRNALRCSDREVALLLHFGPRPSFKRLIHTNDRKPDLPK